MAVDDFPIFVRVRPRNNLLPQFLGRSGWIIPGFLPRLNPAAPLAYILGLTMKRGVLFFALAILSCQRGDPVQIGLDYLTCIEEGKYDEAYGFIDKISKENTTKEDFRGFWEEQETKYGKPYKHEVVETGTDSGMIVIDYNWYYHPPADTHFYQPMRSYRLKLKRDFQGWRVKFRKYKIIKTPRG